MWVSTNEAIKVLGFSRQHLYNLKKDYFKEGFHFRNISRKGAKKNSYQWDIERINNFLNKEARKRC